MKKIINKFNFAARRGRTSAINSKTILLSAFRPKKIQQFKRWNVGSGHSPIGSEILNWSPYIPWKRFRYPSPIFYHGETRIVFYSNWKSKWDLYSIRLKNGHFYDLKRITDTAGNYGPKLYFLENNAKFVLAWHHVDIRNRIRKVRVSESENFIDWSKPVEFGGNVDNCYPSHIMHDSQNFIVFSAGDELYKKNKALFLSPIASPEKITPLNLGSYPNIWRSDIIFFQNKYYCSFETQSGLIVKSSADLKEWNQETALENNYVRPRLSASQDGQTLYMSFEYINPMLKKADIGFMTLLPESKRSVYWITSDPFDNSRPSPVLETGPDEYQIFYTSNYKGIECLITAKFQLHRDIK